VSAKLTANSRELYCLEIYWNIVFFVLLLYIYISIYLIKSMTYIHRIRIIL